MAGSGPIGSRITTLLRAKGMSQSVLAQVSGLKPYEISRYLRGKRRVTVQALELIATALDISVDELVVGTDAEGQLAREHQVVPLARHAEALTELRVAQSEVVELRARVAAVEAKSTTSKTELSRLRATHDDIVLKFRQAEEEVLRTRGQLDESREHVAKLETTVQAQAGQIDGLHRMNRALGLQLAQVQSQLSSYEQAYTALWQERETNRAAALPAASAKQGSEGGALLAGGLLGLGLGALLAKR